MMRRRLQAGMTLIEMMVAVVISMVLSVAVMSVMSTFEGRRRTLGSTSDLDQMGSLAMYQIDRWIRSAGTGLVNTNAITYGCKLFAATTSPSSTRLLPLSASLPAPFASLAENSAATTTFRLAPVVIVGGGTTPGVSGQASDVLVVMSSGNDGAQVPLPFEAPPAAASLTVDNVAEVAPGDLLLLADKQMLSSGPQDCMLTQASSTTATSGVATSLPLAGNYYAATIGSRSVTQYTSNALAIDLGGTSGTGTSLPPSFQVIGVGDNNTLYSYDLLKLAGSAPQAQAEGVFEMHAIYGIDTDGDNKIDNWVDASSSSAYKSDNLTDGSTNAIQLLKNIRAVRVALILRTSLPEKDQVVASSTLTMFSDPDLPSSVALTRTLSGGELNYRYRVVETTIPVRNNQY